MDREPLLEYTEDDEALRDAIRSVVDREMSLERQRRHFEGSTGWHRDGWELAKQLGWPGVAVAPEHGGTGMGLGGASMLAEELGRVVDSTPLLWHAVAGHLLARLDPSAVRPAELEAIAAGDLIAAVSLDPEGVLGDLPVSVAGDGSLSVSGGRSLVGHGVQADVLLADVIYAGGRVLALVRLAPETSERRAMATLDLARPYASLELSSASCTVVSTSRAEFDWAGDVCIALQCAESVGAMRRVVDEVVAYAGARKQFGQPIGSFQAIKHRLADMRIKARSATVATRYALRAVDDRSPDHRAAAAVAAYWVGTSASWVASEALQVFGGIGFTWEHELHLYMRRLKANELLLGSPRFHALALGTEGIRRATARTRSDLGRAAADHGEP